MNELRRIYELLAQFTELIYDSYGLSSAMWPYEQLNTDLFDQQTKLVRAGLSSTTTGAEGWFKLDGFTQGKNRGKKVAPYVSGFPVKGLGKLNSPAKGRGKTNFGIEWEFLPKRTLQRGGTLEKF